MWPKLYFLIPFSPFSFPVIPKFVLCRLGGRGLLSTYLHKIWAALGRLGMLNGRIALSESTPTSFILPFEVSEEQNCFFFFSSYFLMTVFMPGPKNSQALQSLFSILEVFKCQVSSSKFPWNTTQTPTWCCLEQVLGGLNKASKNKSKMAFPQEGKNSRKLEQFHPNLANNPC